MGNEETPTVPIATLLSRPMTWILQEATMKV